MKRITFTACLAAFLFVACNSDNKEKKDEKMGDSEKTESATSESKDKMNEPQLETYAVPDSAGSTKRWQEFATPGDAHKMMAKSNGTWAADLTMWEMPNGPAMKATGTAINKMVMGGRYQITNFTSKMMGMPFEGMSTAAYDNGKKMMTSTWIDNMGTGIMTMEGPWDDATKSSTSTGKAYDAAAGRVLTYKEVFKIVDDNTQTMEMYKPGPDGKEFKCMEIKYTRKK
jgi:hypothetical protein